MVSLAQNVLGELAERPSASVESAAFRRAASSRSRRRRLRHWVPAPTRRWRAVASAVGGSLSRLVVITGEDKRHVRRS